MNKHLVDDDIPWFIAEVFNADAAMRLCAHSSQDEDADIGEYKNGVCDDLLALRGRPLMPTSSS